MSWDVFVFKAPADAVRDADLPRDFPMTPLGPAAEVRQRLRDGVAGLVLADKGWGGCEGPTWTIDLNIGAGDPLTSFTLHVRGSGDDVLDVICDIADAVGARALDLSTEEFLTRAEGNAKGWHGFQEYRNRVLP